MIGHNLKQNKFIEKNYFGFIVLLVRALWKKIILQGVFN